MVGGRKWVVLVALGAAGYAVAGARGCGAARDHGSVANRLWIQRLPRSQRDIVDHLVLIADGGRRIGASGSSSRWLHQWELFKWGLEGSALALYFPQRREKAKRTVRMWKCAGEAPKPFELCLEVRGGARTRLFYSREEWIIEPGAVEESLEAARDAIEDEGGAAGALPSLAHALEDRTIDEPEGPPDSSDAPL